MDPVVVKDPVLMFSSPVKDRLGDSAVKEERNPLDNE